MKSTTLISAECKAYRVGKAIRTGTTHSVQRATSVVRGTGSVITSFWRGLTNETKLLTHNK